VFDLSLEPFLHLERLLTEAQQRGEPEHNAMALATAGADLQPTVRIVYYKGLVRGGLSFYTNYNGIKAKDIALNPKVCLNFYYPAVWQQIRILGTALKLTRAESEAYFKTRARLNQLGAWASNQSEEIPSLDFFQDKMDEIEKKFAGQEVPCPPGWGGFHVIPSEFEFWFGKTGRLHERYVYQRQGDHSWHRFLRSP
jgi:pyridoxamine 5'-phosphate oxidase